MKELIKKYAKGTILSGLIIIGLVIYLEHVLKHSYGGSDNIPTAWELGLKFGDHLGIAFLSIGIIGLLFEAREWREKFHEEIRRVVESVDHLIRLDDDELREAETTIHTAMLRHKNIAKEGGLLYFELTKIKNT